MTEKAGLLLEGKVGKVLKVDIEKGKLTCGKWLRFRMLVDVTKDLNHVCWLNLANSDRRWVTFKWERFHVFPTFADAWTIMRTIAGKLLIFSCRVKKFKSHIILVFKLMTFKCVLKRWTIIFDIPAVYKEYLY